MANPIRPADSPDTQDLGGQHGHRVDHLRGAVAAAQFRPPRRVADATGTERDRCTIPNLTNGHGWEKTVSITTARTRGSNPLGGLVNHKRTIFSVLAGVVMTIACTALALGPAQAGEPSPSPSSSSPTTTSPPPTTPPPTTPPPGAEGCTPGFWKNRAETFPAPYSQSTTLGSVFLGLPAEYASLTFDEALDLGGGGLEALLRQAVAALLNAASADVDYPLSTAEVIALTNAAIASGDYETTKDLFDLYNNLTAPGFCD
jgi:hypothetical protein